MFKIQFISVTILFACIILPMISGCDHPTDANDSGSNGDNNNYSVYNIAGVIRDSVTNEQLDSVYISLPGDTVFFSRYGTFQLMKIKRGNYKMYFTRKHYFTKLYQVELRTDTMLNVELIEVKDPINIDTVDYYPLNIGGTWKYHRLNGDILITEEGIEDWTVIDTNKLENGNIEYLIRTVFNGKSVEYGTTDTTDIINDTHDISITETPNHLLSTPHFNSQFDRYYTESEPDTVKLLYNDGQNELIYKIYLKKNVGMVYSYYQFFPSNIRSMYPYRIYTLIH